MLQPEEAPNPSFPPLEDAPMEDEVPVLPPGSPPPGTSKKFEQFLELKKKGVHFNSKIAQSSALKNPGLMDKLMNFVEIDQADQYKTTLGTDVWDPIAFPKTAYKEQLRQSQTTVGQARARPKGAPVEFVAASGGGSQDMTTGVQATGTPTASTGKRKSRFDT
jgi:hypothetical protein